MATVEITEYSNQVIDEHGWRLARPKEPAITVQQVTISGSSVQSAAFNANTKFVRVHCDEPCRVAFGTNPTAAATSMRLGASKSEIFGAGAGQKVAVITTT